MNSPENKLNTQYIIFVISYILTYNVVRLNLQENSVHIVDECIIFWRKARIPIIQDPSNIVRKIKKLYMTVSEILIKKKHEIYSAVQKEHMKTVLNKI